MNKTNIEFIMNRLVNGIFRYQLFLLVLLAFPTGFFIFQASQIEVDRSFYKTIPTKHAYTQTYLTYENQLGSANQLNISVCHKNDTIFNQEFFTALEGVHNKLSSALPANSFHIRSLFSPQVRYLNIGEKVIGQKKVVPSTYNGEESNFELIKEKIKQNIEKAGLVHSLVTKDYRCAKVNVAILKENHVKASDIDTLNTNSSNTTLANINTIQFTEKLIQDLRQSFEKDNITLHVSGFNAMAGKVSQKVKETQRFFLYSIGLIILLVLLYFKSIILTLITLLTPLISVIWQVGLLSTIGFIADPTFSVIPFIVFSIGFSHSILLVQLFKQRIVQGASCSEATQWSLKHLIVPSGLISFACLLIFATLLNVDIPLLQDYSLIISLGTALVMLSNIIIFPLLMSSLKFKPLLKQPQSPNKQTMKASLASLISAILAKKKNAGIILFFTVILSVISYITVDKVKIGDSHILTNTLNKNSAYNQNAQFNMQQYGIGDHFISVIAEVSPESCMTYETLSLLNQFQWQAENIKGVKAVTGLSSEIKNIYKQVNGGNVKWQTIPRNQQAIKASLGLSSYPYLTDKPVSNRGLSNTTLNQTSINNCTAIPINLYLHEMDVVTTSNVVKELEAISKVLTTPKVQFLLASGTVGVFASINAVITEQQLTMIMAVFLIVILLCLLTLKSLKATIAVVLPLYIFLLMNQVLMSLFTLDLTIYIMPMLTVGIVLCFIYNFYIIDIINRQGMASNKDLTAEQQREAVFIIMLKERGKALLFASASLIAGVVLWFAADFKFLSDIGTMLIFFIFFASVSSLLILPSLMTFLWPKKSHHSD